MDFSWNSSKWWNRFIYSTPGPDHNRGEYINNKKVALPTNCDDEEKLDEQIVDYAIGKFWCVY